MLISMYLIAQKMMPFDVLFGNQSTNTRHIGPLGCKVNFEQTTRISNTFPPRMERSINIFPDGGGVYVIQTKTEIVRTKHVHFNEHVFPGLSIN